MATAPAPTKWDRTEARRRVESPLERLRGRIRLYVVAEGVLVLIVYLCLWFWLGLLVDYGFFKAFTVDWVQQMPRSFRATTLIVLTAGLLGVVALKVFVRVLGDFRDAALALVLERRFPAELGDRLITAVELADPEQARRYGYSQSMIDATVRDAAERVDRLSVEDVFDHARLRRFAGISALLSVGVYGIVALFVCQLAPVGVGEYVARFNTVAGIWVERNILLRDTIWPRRVHLELLNFPASGELRVGRNASPPPLRVRALKWVVADAGAPEGWRALLWSDLPAFLPSSEMPAGAPDAWREWRVDQVELELDKPDTANLLSNDTMTALRSVLARLETLAASPRLARKLRQLEVPAAVDVFYRGETVRSEQKLQSQGDHEYSGVLSDLRESVRFTVRGEDYATPYQRITVVPPPGVSELTRDEYQPAYLYHRLPAGADPKELRGKKQVFRDLPVSLSGSASRIDVPAGTRLVLRAKTDKPLQTDGVRLKGTTIAELEALPADKRAAATARTVALEQTGEQAFEIVCPNVNKALDFIIEVTDTDGVLGQRQVIVKPIEDLPPEVDVQVEVVRKNSQGYLITPLARVPFSGKVRDDHGLDAVEYVCTLGQAGVPTMSGPGLPLSVYQITPGGPTPNLLGFAYLTWLGKTVKAAEERPPEKVPVAAFVRRLKETAEDVPLETILGRLESPPAPRMLRDHVLDPGDGYFDVETLRLKASDDRQAQTHYRLRLWVAGTDNNLETGPGVGLSKERFTFLILSENELLVEIAKEEESLHLKLEDTLNRIKEARGKLDQVAQELPRLKPDEFSPMARRAEEVGETVVRGGDVAREVHTDYRRILRELEVNQVQRGIITRVRSSICDPLESTLSNEFVAADDRLRELLKALEERKADGKLADPARKALDSLIDRLNRVLDAMGDVTSINKIIATLVEIEKGEQAEYRRLQDLKDKLQEKILEDVLGPAKKDDK